MNRRGMFEAKDPGIKLFGKTIPLPENQIPVMSTAGSQIPLKSELMTACNGITEVEGEDFISEDGKLSKTSALECVTHEGQTPLEVNGVKLNSRPTEDEAETDSTGEEKVLKKPDKVIPCPRCNSLDTKFCYFNNYNVNQPRHFCKNCQRYWTAGGTMRNVPVGAGRRKNKHLAPQYRQLIVSSDGVPSTEVANHRLLSCGESSTSFNPSSENTMVFKFGVEPNLCESMGTVLNLAERRRRSVNGGEHGEESSSCASSTTSSSYRENELPSKVIQRTEGNLTGSFNNVVSPHPSNFYPTPPWVFSCGQGWNNGAPMMATHCSSELVYVPETSNLNSVQWCSSPMVAVPGFCAPNTPLQFVPAPYWGWNMMPGSAGCPSPSSSTSNSCSGNGSATLGKHSRDPNLRDDERLEKGILAPKTLRIDDQDEASKNPVWATLGIKPEQKDLLSRCDSFRDHEQPAEGTQILEANPAALSRFRTFQEST